MRLPKSTDEITAAACATCGAARTGLFLRKGLNFAEHFILNTFLTAHAVVLLTVALLGLYLVPQSAALPAMAIALVGACGYVVCGYSRVFPDRPVWAALGGTVVLALGTAAWFLTLVLLLRLHLAGPGG